MSITLSTFEGQQQKTALLSKVPQITLFFWITKLLTTAMGEAASDFFVHLDPIAAVLGGAGAFAGSLLLQFAVSRYIPWIYWLVVAMVAVFGTMAADMLHGVLGVSHPAATLIFAIALALVFLLWYRVEGTLSVHHIVTRRREAFYWLTVFVSFALGTAAGDWTAGSLHLGTLYSGFLFLALIALPAIAYLRFGASEVLTFWIAYILTRPLGASFADWAGDPVTHGGVGLGHGPVAAVLTALIIALVAYLAIARIDVEKRAD